MLITPLLNVSKKMHYNEKNLNNSKLQLWGLGVQATCPIGTERLPLQVGDNENLLTIETNFLIVNIPVAYNVILGFNASGGSLPLIYSIRTR